MIEHKTDSRSVIVVALKRIMDSAVSPIVACRPTSNCAVSSPIHGKIICCLWLPQFAIRHKGMKQKIALVLAFMHDPQIVLLDEPTSGLDPLMQKKFCDLISSEKKRGKTVLLSSHLFDEVEKTCDRVMIIKHGEIIVEVDMVDVDQKQPDFVITKFSLENYFMKYYGEEK